MNIITATRFAASDLRVADRADPLPPDSMTATADLAIRFALALMPFTAIAFLFIDR